MYRPPSLYRWLLPTLLWRVPDKEPYLYLTFDDGPIPGPTEFVLDILGKEEIRATFFMIGDNVRKYPAVYRRVLEEGHAIGNHTFNHLNGWRTSTEVYVENVAACGRQLEAHGGPAPLMFRPPYGKITRGQARKLASYKVVMWDILTNDFNKNIKPETCLKNTLERLRPGSIIVMHDSMKAQKNLQYVLPRLLTEAGSRGFTFKTLEFDESASGGMD